MQTQTQTQTQTQIQSIEDFFKYMFTGLLGHLEIMLLDKFKIPNAKSFPLHDPNCFTDATKRIETFKRMENCYFGVCPRIEEVTRHAEEHLIVDVPCIWADVDGKKLDVPLEQQLQKIMSLPILPSLIIMSGNGYHCYWKLKQPFRVSTPEDKAYIKGIIKGMGKLVDGDDVFNLDRVLRVPFTYNLKDAQNPKKVEIVHFDPSLTYDVSIFEPYKTEISVEEVLGQNKYTVKKKRLESLGKYDDLIKKAETRIWPHIKKVQTDLNLTDEQVEEIVHHLKNGEVVFNILDLHESEIRVCFDIDSCILELFYTTSQTENACDLNADVKKVVKYMHNLKTKEIIEKEHVDLMELPTDLQSKIIRGGMPGYRSELDYSVIYRLRELGYTPEAIEALYENPRYAIGNKYREKGNSRKRYLYSVIRSVDAQLNK